MRQFVAPSRGGADTSTALCEPRMHSPHAGGFQSIWLRKPPWKPASSDTATPATLTLCPSPPLCSRRQGVSGYRHCHEMGEGLNFPAAHECLMNVPNTTWIFWQECIFLLATVLIAMARKCHQRYH